MFRSPSVDSPHVMESAYGADSCVWGAPSSYGVTALSTSWGGMLGYVPPMPGLSTWGMPPLEDATPPRAHHNPTVLASNWEDWTARNHSKQAGSGAVGSSDGTTHPPATTISQGPASNTVPAGGAAARLEFRVRSHFRLLCHQTCSHRQPGCPCLWEAGYSRPGQ